MNYLTFPAWLARLFQRLHLRRTRLARLLRRRGVDTGAYLRAFPIVAIETQIACCYSCQSKALCDRALASRGHGRSRYSFCPNTSVVERYLALTRRGASG
jgi:hypothetical protein